MFPNLRYAVGLLRRRPAFSTTCLATLILGIALNTIAFGIVNALWFRPLPFPEGDRMVVIYEHNAKSGTRSFTSFATYRDWRNQARSFESMAAAMERSCNVVTQESGHETPETVGAAFISVGAVEFMGFRPLKGRSFVPEDENATVRAVMIGEQHWKKRFASDPEIIGRKLMVDGEPAEVVGVLPYRFQILYGGYQLVSTLDAKSAGTGRSERALQVVGRLKPGVSAGGAQAEMAVIAARIAAAYPVSNRDWDARVSDYRKFLFAQAIRMYPLLLTGSALVLLIVCANISNLYLAQAIGRRKEIAVRAALGATRPQIVRQMLAEGWLLAAAGGLIAFVAVVWVREILVASFPELSELQADFRVFAYTAFVSLLAGTVFGLAPALTASRPDISEVLKCGGRAGQTRGTHRLRRILVVSELGLSLMLLAATGLLVRTAWKMRTAEPGFTTARLMTSQLILRGDRYATPARKAAFVRELEERLAGLPEIEGIAVMGRMPLLGGGAPARLEITTAPAWSRQVYMRPVGSTFHDVLGNRLIAGRKFLRSDVAGSEPVVILNESLAEKISPGNMPGALDRQVRMNGGMWRRVIGISTDVRQVLTEPASPEVLVPLDQEPSASVWVAVRAKRDPETVAILMRKEIARIDPALALGTIQTMADIVEGYFPLVMIVGLFGFSVVALSIAALGLYGVVASAVIERTREIGIRIALGADGRSVVRKIVADCMKMAAWGCGAGLLGALVLARVMASLLFDVSPADPVVFGTIAVLLLLVVIGAGYLPARRASRINPIIALREE